MDDCDFVPVNHHSNEPVMVPPISQIPGLSQIPGGDDVGRHSNIRPTDTDYIVLCKQGGRRDLLDYRPVFRPQDLEDNALADRMEREKDQEPGVTQSGRDQQRAEGAFGGAAECLVHHDWREAPQNTKKQKPRQPCPYRVEEEPPKSRGKKSAGNQRTPAQGHRATAQAQRTPAPAPPRAAPTTLPVKSAKKKTPPKDDTTMAQIMSFGYARK